MGKMKMNYQHKQIGFVLITLNVIMFLLLVDLLVLGVIFYRDRIPGFVNPLLVTLIVIIIVTAVLFAIMTVKIEDGRLIWHFGFGFWKKSVDVNDITSSEAVRNKWWYGWGIRKIPDGWLYTVSGLDAVEFKLENGRTFRLGSDQAGKLIAAINESRS